MMRCAVHMLRVLAAAAAWGAAAGTPSRDKEAAPRNLTRLHLQSQWAACAHHPHRAVVFSTGTSKRDRWVVTREELWRRGVCAARYPGCTKDDVVQLVHRATECRAFGRGDATHEGAPPCRASSRVHQGSVYLCRGTAVAGVHTWKPTNFLYNALTQLKAWSEVAGLVAPGEHMLFFEDDIAVHPRLAGLGKDAFAQLLTDALLVSGRKRHGFAYLGLCGPICSSSPALAGLLAAGAEPGVAVEFKACTGACAHAYAMSGDALRALDKRRAQLLASATGADADAATLPPRCPRFTTCVHDPAGAHHILRQGCTEFDGGWLDGATGEVTANASRAITRPTKRWRDIDVCGNLYGSNLRGVCASGHDGS